MESHTYQPGVVYAQAQRFEQGMILRLQLPRAAAPVQWVLLAQDAAASQYWSFVMQVALLGSDAPIYRAWEHCPPVGRLWPDDDFGVLWVAMRDLLGWGIEAKVDYQFAYEPRSDNLCDLPRLYDADGRQITLNADRTWSVEPRHVHISDAA